MPNKRRQAKFTNTCLIYTFYITVLFIQYYYLLPKFQLLTNTACITQELKCLVKINLLINWSNVLKRLVMGLKKGKLLFTISAVLIN